MKVGILTYTKEYANLGTNMQSYCTLQGIREAYPAARVELIDYAIEKPSRRPYFSQASLRSLRKDYIRIKKYDHFFQESLIFSEEALTTTDVKRALEFIQRQNYDVIYVGSDTVLELKGATADGITPYWLDPMISGTAVFAAASSHNVTFEKLSSRQKDLMERSLNKFSLLGVRDDATARLLTRFVGADDKRVRIVPDPTFTYDIDYSFIEQYFAQQMPVPRLPMVCLHLLRDTEWAQELADKFRSVGYIVASLRPARYADIIFTDLSPFEQLGLYRYFALVITYRFHDTIFSLKNLTPVIAFPEKASDVTEYGESKIATLLKAFGLTEESYVSDRAALSAESLFTRHWDAILRFTAKREQIASVLSKLRNSYKAFINHSKALV